MLHSRAAFADFFKKCWAATQRLEMREDNKTGDFIMATMDNSITKKQLTTLALLGFLILGLFVAGFVWLVYSVRVSGAGGGELFLAYAPYWTFPYLIVGSVYVGFFAARFAQGRWKQTWFWGISGFALTLIFLIGIPRLLANVFPFPSPEIFGGPAIFAFLAPILSALLLALLISRRSKATE
jgi:hypothetical protein